MRGLLLACLLIMPSATALLTDAADDVEVSGFPIGLGEPEMSSYADLLALDVSETSDAFTFTLTAAAMPESATPEESGTRYDVEFDMGRMRYQLQLGRSSIEGLSTGYYAFWGHYRGDEVVQDARLEPVVDHVAGTMHASIPREWIRDDNGAIPGPGRPLTNITVASEGLAGTIQCAEGVCLGSYYRDRMPDAGAGSLDVVHGVAQTGHAHLSAERPFRASNGGATTYVYEVLARNLGDDDRFTFEARDVPSGWSVWFPSDRLRLEPDEEALVPVVVETPSGHRHGGQEAFLVEMVSQRDSDAVGRVELGVYFPDPPQPAGHHDTLYVHSRITDPPLVSQAVDQAFGFRGATSAPHAAFMHTLAEDPGAEDVPIDAARCGIDLNDPDRPVEIRYCWVIPLHDGLQMGLDLDLARTGLLDVLISSPMPLLASGLSGEVVHLGPVHVDAEGNSTRTRTAIATLPQSDLQDIQVGTAGNFVLPVLPASAGDLIPHVDGAGLVLRLELRTLTAANALLGPNQPPVLHSGGALEMPLNEYADPVEGYFVAVPDIALFANGPAEQLVNPGKTVIFEVVLRNNGTAGRSMDLQLQGSEHARILGTRHVDVQPGQRVTVGIAFTAPTDATHGQRHAATFQALDEDGAVFGLLHLAAVIEAEQEIPDDSEEIAAFVAEQRSPAPPLAWLTLALIAMARRR